MKEDIYSRCSAENGLRKRSTIARAVRPSSDGPTPEILVTYRSKSSASQTFEHIRLVSERGRWPHLSSAANSSVPQSLSGPNPGPMHLDRANAMRQALSALFVPK